MVHFLLLSPSVFRPTALGIFYIALLPLLCPAAEKEHQHDSISAKINSIAWSEIDFNLTDAFAQRLHMRCVACG